MSEPRDYHELFRRTYAVLQKIRPAIQADGGDVELVEITDDGIARVRFHGTCIGCPSSHITLQLGIEANLTKHIPEIHAVEEVL